MNADTVETYCDQCGSALTPEALSCPSCHRLTHAPELERLASEATAATESGDRKDADSDRGGCFRQSTSNRPVGEMAEWAGSHRTADLEVQGRCTLRAY